MSSNAPMSGSQTDQTVRPCDSLQDGAPTATVPLPESSSISALVCTRNRGDKVFQTIDTILANDHRDFTLLVVDQSTDDLTEVAVQRYAGDARFRYLRTPTKGIGLARDVGIREAETDLVAITDDDCDVPVDWLTELQEAFDAHPAVAVIYCDVRPGPHDYTKGYIPHFLVPTTRLLSRLTSRDATGIGIGAGMAVRRRPILDLGGSDHLLGAGTSLPAAEDSDLGYRALFAGHQVLQLASSPVIHHGYRTLEEYSRLLSGYLAGTVGMYVKHIKCGHPRAFPLLVQLTYFTLLKPLASALRELRKPPILNRFVGMVRGGYIALRTPVNKSLGVFKSSYIHSARVRCVGADDGQVPNVAASVRATSGAT